MNAWLIPAANLLPNTLIAELRAYPFIQKISVLSLLGSNQRSTGNDQRSCNITVCFLFCFFFNANQYHNPYTNLGNHVTCINSLPSPNSQVWIRTTLVGQGINLSTNKGETDCSHCTRCTQVWVFLLLV